MDLFNDDTFLSNGFARLDTRSRSGTPEEATDRISRRDKHTARTALPDQVQPKIRSFSEMPLTRTGLETSKCEQVKFRGSCTERVDLPTVVSLPALHFACKLDPSDKTQFVTLGSTYAGLMPVPKLDLSCC